MKITFAVSYFPPEIGSAADLFCILSKEFLRQGFNVEVLTTEPRYYNLVSASGNNIEYKKTKKLQLWYTEQRNNIVVNRLKLLPVIYPRSGKDSRFRSLEHISQPFMFLAIIPKIITSDILIVYSPPLLLGYFFSIFGKLFQIPTIVNVQDIHPQAIIDLGLTTNKTAIRVLELIENQMYRLADSIVVHSVGNKKIVIKHGASLRKVSVIPNACTIPSDTLLGEGKKFREKYDIKDNFLVTYAGIMSFSQDLHTVLKAAKILKEIKKEILFIMAGDGPERADLVNLAKSFKLDNVIFIPFQAGEDYWRLISASDVCLVSLKGSKVKTPVVPRKLHDIMAANKSLVAHVPEGDVRTLIETVKCGLFINPENPLELADAIKKMCDLPCLEREKFGNNGRVYAMKNFSVEANVSRFIKIIKKIVKNN